MKPPARVVPLIILLNLICTNFLPLAAVPLPVKLNEVLASNHSFTNRDGTTSDWLELYNPTTAVVDLAGASLSNDTNAPRKFVFASATRITPKGFLFLYCDDQRPSSRTNTGFSLGANGDSVFLYDTLANGGLVVDSITFGLQVGDLAIGCVPDGSGTWNLTTPSPQAANVEAPRGSVTNLSINEWMADPSTGSDWFELFQGGDLPVALGGLFFTDDLNQPTMSPIPALSFIGTGRKGFQVFVADSSPKSGADHVKFKLSKSGATIGLFSTAATLLTSVSFGAQQSGISQGRLPDGSSIITNFPNSVSAGESNFRLLPNVLINEILTHTDPPLEDALELYNPTGSPMELGGWFLSNSKDNLKKYKIPTNTPLPARGFHVFYEYQFNTFNSSGVPFTFNSAHGDDAIVSEADSGGNLTGYRAYVSFGPAANGVSFGRYTNSMAEIQYLATSAISFGVDNPVTVAQFRTGTGAVNPAARVGPVEISEIMFEPPRTAGTNDDTQNEYIELHNITAFSVPLYNPSEPTNTWKLGGGIDFVFPRSVILPAGGYILLVNFDPASDLAVAAEFRNRYSLGASTRLFGPYGGHLSNSGETLALYKPDPIQQPPHPDAGFVPYVLVEEVAYSSSAPWPTGADATGSSLQRINPARYANDPANWFVAAPTPGKANGANPNDLNGDGLPDSWQIEYFGSITKPEAAPDADPDSDTAANLQEYWAGTNPTNALSSFKIEAVDVWNGNIRLLFNALAGRTYTVSYANDPAASSWQKLTDVAAQPTNREMQMTDPVPLSAGNRFYRLQTPAQP